MKKIITILIALTMWLSFSLPAFAVDSGSLAEIESTESVARVEETEWYYRYYQGQQQKRLWSITYMKWLTEWIPY